MAARKTVYPVGTLLTLVFRNDEQGVLVRVLKEIDVNKVNASFSGNNTFSYAAMLRDQGYVDFVTNYNWFLGDEVTRCNAK